MVDELKPKLTAQQKAQRLRDRLARVETRLVRYDDQRLRVLVDSARLYFQTQDWEALFAASVEIARMARQKVIGLQGMYPARPLSTMPPPAAELTEGGPL